MPDLLVGVYAMKTRIFLVSLFITALQAAVLNGGSGSTISWVTTPSADVTLSFVQPGKIDKINFKEGDIVKVDDCLIRQYDAVEKAQLAQLEADSNNMTQILAGEAKLSQSKVDLDRKRQAQSKGAAPATEVEYAELNLKIAELSLRLAVFQHEQAIRKFQESKLQLNNMSMKSPIDGKIEEMYVEAGESVNALAKVVRVVRIDPLWIDVRVPMAQAANLNYGNPAVVEFPEPQKSTVEGTIIFKAAVAESASETIKVRIQVPNRTNRPAGEHVKVSFQSTGGSTTDTTRKPEETKK
jgi:RND family efflux transporter MFP subunit